MKASGMKARLRDPVVRALLIIVGGLAVLVALGPLVAAAWLIFATVGLDRIAAE